MLPCGVTKPAARLEPIATPSTALSLSAMEPASAVTSPSFTTSKGMPPQAGIVIGIVGQLAGEQFNPQNPLFECFELASERLLHHVLQELTTPVATAELFAVQD